MFHLKRIAAAVSLALFITGCSQDNSEQATAPSEAHVAQTQEAPVESAVSESEKANELFESIFMENVMRSPMYQSYLGIKQDQDNGMTYLSNVSKKTWRCNSNNWNKYWLSTSNNSMRKPR